MSHAAAAPHAHPGASEDDDDDYEAGSNIGKMLSILFLYTVLVMGISAYVTYRWIMSPPADAAAESAEGH
jgi:hypothetical protein